MLYRYYKGHEKRERWKVIAVEHEESRLSSDSVAFATVLAITERVKAGESVSEDVKYQGPFYIDIDSDSIASSIKTANKVVTRLLGNSVPAEAISLWASGKRGFHITVPMSCFTEEKPVAKLPLAYRQMALSLGLFDLQDVDTTVYSTGKGRMWRLPNKQRDDNNRFKVPLSLNELEVLTVEGYETLVSAKRELPELKTVKKKVAFLEGLYKLALSRAEQMEKPKGVFIDPNLKKALKDGLPPCAEDLKNYRNLREGKGFNEISLQFAKSVSSFSPKDAKELIDEFANNSHGNTYNTPAKRKQHCQTAFRIASKSSGYDWSCTSALSVLKEEPCFNCPIAFIRNEEEETEDENDVKPKSSSTKVTKKPEIEIDLKELPLEGLIIEDDDDPVNLEPVVEDNGSTPPAPPSQGSGGDGSGEGEDDRSGFTMEGLLETDDGYGFMDGGGKFRRVSNFLIKIKEVFVEYVPNLERDIRVAVRAEVLISKRVVGKVFLEEGNWNSKSSFIGAFLGLANAAFYGKDDDVQKMKSALMLDVEKSSTTVRRVYSVGVQRQQIGDRWVFTYVEPGWSIDQYGNEDFYTLSGKVVAYPRLKPVKPLELKDSRTSEMLRAMFQVNLPYRVAQVLGWNMACFLKQHIFTFRNEFPLLSLHGEPGSGKTSTASLFAGLHGVDYRIEDSPVNLPTSTGFSAWTFVASSTTIPRLMEEFNKSKMNPKAYDLAAENFKACWNQHAVQRGTIKGEKLHGGSQIGAHVVQIPLTGPVVICSEQAVTMVSLVERMIQVQFNKREKEHLSYEKAFSFASARLEWLRPFAKAAYSEALSISPEEIQSWFDEASELVPYEITARPRYSYQVLLIGLMFLERIINKYELSCLEEFKALKNSFITWLSDNRSEIATVKRTSEIDAIVAKWNTMAAMSMSEGQLPWMVKGSQYLRKGDTLYIDYIVAHPQYMRYVSTIERAIPVIDNVREFLNLVKGESYCISTSEVIDNFARGRPVLALSCSKMAMKGILTSGFEDSGE